MKLRLFVAINLPEGIKDKISEAVYNLKSSLIFPIRFLTPENWHLTITFLGYQEAESVPDILQAIEATAETRGAPIIEFQNIDYGPAGDSSPARMIWLNGSETASKQLAGVKTDLETNLHKAGVRFRAHERLFHAHLTLARFEPQPRRTLPPIQGLFRHQFQAQGLDLMQSHLKRTGAEYELLSSFDFKKDL